MLLLIQEHTLVADVPKHLTKWNCYKNISENTSSLMASNTGASNLERVLVRRQAYKTTFGHMQETNHTSVSSVKRVLVGLTPYKGTFLKTFEGPVRYYSPSQQRRRSPHRAYNIL